MRKTVLLIGSLLWLLSAAPVYALVSSDVEQLKPGMQLQLPVADSDEDRMETLQIDSIGVFNDQGGGRTYRLDGRRPDGQVATVFLDTSAPKIEASVVLRRMKLRDVNANPKTLWKFDKLGEGELVLEEQHYRYNPEDSEDSRYTDGKPGAAPREVSYYTFNCVEDDDLALVVLEWSDDDFEVYQTGWIDAGRITQK